MEDKITKIFRYLLIVILGYFTFKIFSGETILIINSTDLIFHEAGHFILIFGGETMHFLGGTLGQMFFPLLFAIYFILKKQLFSVSIMAWWLGENLSGIGIYMADARAQILPLLGGAHDWEFLFAKFNLLDYDAIIGKTFWWLGIIFMVFSLIGAIIINWKKLNNEI